MIGITNFFDKEDIRNIKKLNDALGMQHRSKPYNFNNPAELNEALKFAFCAFSDYCSYAITLDNLIENFDESLEYYDTATWINFTENINKADKLSMDGYNALCKAAKIMTDISNRAEAYCKEMLQAVLKSPKEHQTQIFGQCYQLPDQEMDGLIEDLFDNYDNFDFHYNMEENYESFIKVVNKNLEKYITS